MGPITEPSNPPEASEAPEALFSVTAQVAEIAGVERITDAICEVLKKKMSTGQVNMMKPDFRAAIYKAVKL